MSQAQLPEANKKTNSPVIARRSVLPYRVFYTWDIHYACNYRCSYCYFFKRWEEVAKENRYIEVNKWKDIWDSIFLKYGTGHIHISGGEPFTYPSINDLVAHLTNKFTVEFDTNLSFDAHEFMRKVGPERVRFAAAFHPEFIDIDAYLKKALLLKKNGYDLGINYVGYPAQLARMKEYKEAFENEHISFDIMPFRGEYQGRTYPKGYREEEKELIRNCDPRTAAKMLESYGQEKKMSHRDEVCRMGQMYTKIHPDATAYRCCYISEKGKLGNLIDGTFSLSEEPKPCEYDECSCWVAMIADKEKDWSFHWRLPNSMQEAVVL